MDRFLVHCMLGNLFQLSHTKLMIFLPGSQDLGKLLPDICRCPKTYDVSKTVYSYFKYLELRGKCSLLFLLLFNNNNNNLIITITAVKCVLWDFNLQKDHKIQASGENLIMLNR